MSRGEKEIGEFDVCGAPGDLFEEDSAFVTKIGECREKRDECMKDWCRGRWFAV